MKKFTKGSNKKIIAGSVAVLSALAVVSTGFASWVISQNAEVETEGTISVETVSNNALKLEVIDDGTETAIKFGHKSSSTVYDWLTSDEKDSEDLTATIKVKLSNAAGLDHYDIGLADATDKYDAAADAKLVGAMPSYTENGGIVLEAGTPDASGNRVDTITVTFKWGLKFGNVNPYEYYNAYKSTDTIGETATTYAEDAYTNLKALEALNSEKYTLTITAVAKTTAAA